MASVHIGRRRSTKQSNHVIGHIGVACPNLAAVDKPAFVNLCCLGFGGKQVRAGTWFAHADDKAQFAATDARQNVRFNVFGRIFEQNRTALPVRHEMRPNGRIRDAKFLCHDVTLEKTSFVPAILFRPCHSDPAPGPDTFAEGSVVRVAMPWPVRIEGAFSDFVGKKRAHLLS